MLEVKIDESSLSFNKTKTIEMTISTMVTTIIAIVQPQGWNHANSK
jgi:hypothetical protein